MTTGLPDFFKYNLWANLRLLDTCVQLSDTQLDATMIGTFGSVRETLMHLFGAEEGYAWALTGTSPTVSENDNKCYHPICMGNSDGTTRMFPTFLSFPYGPNCGGLYP
jgi:uncharacterized damage-inducible protein DinB